MAIDTSKFAVQQIFVVDALDLDDGSLITRFEDLKNSTLSNNGTVVYAQGGVGNPKIIGFSHSKESQLSIESAVITEGAIGIQTGSGVKSLTDTQDIPFDEALTVGADNSATTTYTATGETGKEIGFAYVLNGDGTVAKKLEQGENADTAGKFTYTTAGKKLVFNATDAPVGSKVLVIYKPKISSAKQITNSTETFAKNVRLNCKTLFRDTCSGKDYVGVLVIYKAKAGEEWSLELAADGDPAVHSITFEALKSCESPVLWDIFIYDTADIATT